MNIRIWALGVISAVAVASANANLIVNGSFEDPDEGTGWGAYASIPGWTAVSGGIEIGHASIYGVTNHHLDQVLEPDYLGNSTIEQLVGTTPSTSYFLSFGVAKRSGILPENCQIEVWWDGSMVTLITPTSTVMSYYGYWVTASASVTSLQFRGAGPQAKFGGLVDDVQLTPEPASLAILGLGVLAVFRKKRG